MPTLFDVHTHVQFHAYKDDADAVVRRALDAGIWMVNVGTQQDMSLSAIAFAEKYPEGVYATVGLHPVHTGKSYHDKDEIGDNAAFTDHGEEFDYNFYKKIATHPKVVAIGECGLDYYRIENQESRIKQENVFRQHIELAKGVKKPLMIHCRSAFSDLIRILVSDQVSNVRCPGVVHFFSGTKDDAGKLLDLGFSFSFGGVLTFTRDYDEVVRHIPLERIVLETDAPYITPVPYRGRRNEPLYITEVAKKLAEIKNVSFEEVSLQTTKNAKKIFRIS